MQVIEVPRDQTVIHVGEACKDKAACFRKEGLIKCSIVPPERLYNPVLNFRANQKVMFRLFLSCALT